MIKGGKLSVYEGVMLTTLIIMSKILYTSTPVVVKQVGTAAWYMTLVSCVVSIILFLLVCILMNRFPGKNLVEIHEAVIGKVPGKVASVILSGALTISSASILREFLEMIKVYNLPDTPPSVIIITFLAVVMLLSYKGLEGIVRIACLNFYPIIFGLCIILVLAIPYYNFDYLKPYFGYGLKKTIYVGFLRSSAYQEFMTLTAIVTSINNKRGFRKIGIISIVLSGIIFSISFICYLMAFQYTMGEENLSGIFQMSRIIHYNRYFQRIDSIFLFTWVISALITVATGFYLSIRVYCQCFGIEDHRPIIPSFALLMYVATLIPKNISELFGKNMYYLRQYSGFFSYGMPILLLTISLIFRKEQRIK